MGRLLRAELRERALALLLLGLAAFLFMVAVTATYEVFVGGQAITAYRVPRLLAAFAGSQRTDLYEPSRYLAFGFNHPLFIALTVAAGIWLGATSVADDVASGRAQLLYVRPIDRRRVMDGRLLVWLGVQTLAVAAGLAGAAAGIALSSSLAGTIGATSRMALAYLPLAWVLGAGGFAAGAWTRRPVVAVGIATGAVVVAYLLNFASLVWAGARPLRWLSPFAYFDPATAASGVSWARWAALAGATLVVLAAARWRVGSRDLV